MTHQLKSVWDNYPEFFTNDFNSIEAPVVENFIAEMFSLGEFYYYVLNVSDGTISNIHPKILAMHGLPNFPTQLHEIIDLIHPDDVSFVVAAENATLIKMREIGFQYQMQLKSSYCFRMKVADGEYELFHHQALHIARNEAGQLLQAINIHTNINHLTKENNYIVTVSGVAGRSDFHQIQLKPIHQDRVFQEKLTRREIEILRLVIKGFSSNEIAKQLFLSAYTVKTHRKNIHKKTFTKNNVELIKKSLEWGYV
ncbi:LuxR C-terminal-related transcriptional regulator [Sphingobacterium hungaricum]|uniref:Helix-turn-helix transcriptional regulator n=1 Tax=Sphingobacterium hungaricum TaxID=2082723 RepID=A0A928UW78_9SPHI|nr:LuxR C-terminal-related transcriptional regulator [Sphingobacterium hungaricum]MBE8714451.1 helix-turn-helix transcriptional regulator [Sphingobacterium hungaricum]